MLNEDLTPEENFIVKWQYRLLDDFFQALVKAICMADETNLYRLSRGFPNEVSGYRRYTTEEGWWQKVQKKIGKHEE